MPQVQFSQRDDRWKNQRLGTCDGVTVGSAGCYVTSFANIASHFGKDTNPGRLDQYFTDNNSYVQGCLCRDEMLQDVYPDIKFLEVFHFENRPADFSVLVNTWEDEYVIELDADPNQPGLQTHFNRFWSYENGKLLILDSWTGEITNVADVYGDPVVSVQKIVHYRGPSQTSKPIVEVKPPVAVDPVLPDPHEVVAIPEAPIVDPTPPKPIEVPITPTVPIPATTQGSEVIPLNNTWSSFFVSLRSRKLILAVVSALVAGANVFFGWKLDTGQILTIIGPLIGFVAIEGTADAMERKALAQQPTGDTTTTVVNK